MADAHRTVPIFRIKQPNAWAVKLMAEFAMEKCKICYWKFYIDNAII